MNAADIITALAEQGITATWENTGGGVYNIVADIDYVGTVQISDGGDWSEGDVDTEVDFEGVTVIGYDTEGDSVCDERIDNDDIWAKNIAEVLALFHDMAEAVRETFLNTDDCCSECGLVFPVRSMTDQTRFGYDPTRVMTCAACIAEYAPLSAEALADGTPVDGKPDVVEITGWRYCSVCGLSVVACNGTDRKGA